MKLSLIIPCYNEERTIEDCVSRVLGIAKGRDFSIEAVVVDDASTDRSLSVLEKIAKEHEEVTVLRHERNRGKGAALRTGLMRATGDFVGIQDADAEYDPAEYVDMLEPLLDGRADVVYGSRYLRPDTRRVLYFWHTWMNKALTFVSNMFTNLDITDMETCYKLFRGDVIRSIAPTLREERFGFEPEITAKVAQERCRVYECAISYNPRTYEEGKKIGWKDGFHALYCILHYSAPTAPLPMQILIYFFIGFLSLLLNLSIFSLTFPLTGTTLSIVGSFMIAAVFNYLLCVSLLFRHKARWDTFGEAALYVVSVALMGLVDYGVTLGLMALSWSPGYSKFWAAVTGFVGNFIVRKYLVFPEKKRVR
ncbi:MAG: bifunctional glycosyltransferase family 2/GtrA family protein [Synergistaceae bacterium]|nr:bifunctional glycosyltransferase family 2/GtrA family protein [Synergistaceae bacterium]